MSGEVGESTTTASSKATNEEIQEAIRSLIKLCSSQNVGIPEQLNQALYHVLGEDSEEAGDDRVPFAQRLVSDKTELEELTSEDPFVQEFRNLQKKLKIKRPNTSVHVKNGSFKVTNFFYDEPNLGDTPLTKQQKIKTIYNSGIVYCIQDRLQRIWRTGKICEKRSAKEQLVMRNINLLLEPGKTYLVLGAPRSGKSTLLKLIAGILPHDKEHEVGGTVQMNGIDSKSEDVVWSNCAGYIDQIDRLHPFLTVQETCEFAWRCRSGGTHRTPMTGDGSEVDEEIEKMNKDLFMVMKVLQGMGLKRVANTFVGDQETVRGVSGGEKKRVTVAEMGVGAFPILCADEISTGLDAATTFDICRLMRDLNQLTKNIKIVSLLQPPPETFTLFDELILLSDGQIIYSGPVEQVVPHFQSLGYQLPDRMDVADWLQALPTKDGKNFLMEKDMQPLSSEEFSQKFYESEIGKHILKKLDSEESPVEENTSFSAWMKQKFRNDSYSSLKLLVEREMLLWWRDKTPIYARVAQDLIMGLVAGTLFWQGSDDPTSVMGILFQSMFFVSVGAMLKVAPQYAVRGTLYKHQDANFFPTWTYVVGRSLASIPASIIDGILYGSIIFWFVGLAHDDGASVANYFLFVLLILVASVTIGLLFSIFPAITPDRSTGQACMSVATVVLVLFSGYTVQPNVIPDYWIWAYHLNLFAWALRGLAVNEFASGKYDDPSPVPGQTEGQVILERFGFIDRDGEAYGFEWAWWAILFNILVFVCAVIGTSICYNAIRFATGKSLANDSNDNDNEKEDKPEETVNLPFQKADLTFRDIHYTVNASVGNEKLELLKGISGVVEAGKMTALMGSSGAGKTTLMDVLALRKSSGEIEGEIRLNGHLQEEKSFRRCTGYVEQFDTQSAQLTIRETCLFSAKLRLDSSREEVTKESTEKFVDQTLRMLEMTEIQDLQVGDDSGGGLSFEQRKRLSIAVELVANPSIIFLDEPTSGLDARAASIVIRGLKRIASSGRAVCATIHQPSIAIFSSFDALLLLKRGGETVFFGDLGESSSLLIEYLESYRATPKIQPGENPATWMLTTIGAGSASTTTKPFDYAASYQVSDLRKKALQKIETIQQNTVPGGKIEFANEYATSTSTQISETMNRAFTIYWRSPSYNSVRLVLSVLLALLIGSVYVSDRVPEDEGDMNSRATTIFLAYLFMGVNSMNTVLAVFEAERNMYYRHKAAKMYDNRAIAAAFTVAEIPFIILSSLIYVTVLYFMIGFAVDARKFFLFYLFFFLTFGIFTFLGQMFVSLNRDSVTAQGFGGLFITFTSLFTGVLIRPANIPNAWVFMYWLMPGHYIFEGIVTSQFENDDTPIIAFAGTPFWNFLGCDEQIQNGAEVCVGTAEQWVFASFEGEFIPDHIPGNIVYLVGLMVVTRVVTALALHFLNFRRT